VERAGVEVRERETLVLRFELLGAFDLARLEVRLLECLAGFAVLATGLRDERRALALTLRRDAAFNCFPLLWIVTPAFGATAGANPAATVTEV
jgi:hypothetical protein